MLNPHLEHVKRITKKVMVSIGVDGSNDLVYKTKEKTSPLVIATEYYNMEDLVNHLTSSGDKEKYNLIIGFKNSYIITQVPFSKTLLQNFIKTHNIVNPEKVNITEFADWCNTIKPHKHKNYISHSRKR